MVGKAMDAAEELAVFQGGYKPSERALSVRSLTLRTIASVHVATKAIDCHVLRCDTKAGLGSLTSGTSSSFVAVAMIKSRDQAAKNRRTGQQAVLGGGKDAACLLKVSAWLLNDPQNIESRPIHGVSHQPARVRGGPGASQALCGVPRLVIPPLDLSDLDAVLPRRLSPSGRKSDSHAQNVMNQEGHSW